MQFPEKLIPKTILLASQNKNIPVYGNGKNVRDWIFVTDHCNAILDIMQNGKSQQSYNISAHNAIDNITIVEQILSKMDCSLDLIEFVEDRPGHDYRYAIDSSKIRNELNWSESKNFEDGLQITIDWYLNNAEWYKGLSSDVFKPTPWKN